MHKQTLQEKILSDETYNIIGSCMSVHNELGNGFLEAVFQEALEKEFQLRGIPFVRESELTILYKGQPLQKRYIADFICYNEIIVELKALSSLDPIHEAQVINYLKATNMQIGLLVNFGQSSLQHKRIFNKNFKSRSVRFAI